MTYGPKQVKTFESEKKANEYAKGFAYAREFSKLKPLFVKQVGENEWGVFNPGNIPKEPVPR